MVLDVRRLWTLAGLCLVVRTKVSDWDRCLMIPMHTAQTTKAGHLPSSLRTCTLVCTLSKTNISFLWDISSWRVATAAVSWLMVSLRLITQTAVNTVERVMAINMLRGSSLQLETHPCESSERMFLLTNSWQRYFAPAR